jgi:hypothetical protein
LNTTDWCNWEEIRSQCLKISKSLLIIAKQAS